MTIRKNLLPVLLVPTGIVLIPALAMLLQADGWAWSASDFIVAWIFIAGTLLSYRLVAARATSRAYRAAAGIALTTGFVLLWIVGAVGLIGSEQNPANRMYAGVLAIGVIGTVLARLKPLGMAVAMTATALAQFLVPIVALILWRADFSPGVVPVFGLNFGFVLLFGGSALLFRLAASSSGEAT